MLHDSDVYIPVTWPSEPVAWRIPLVTQERPLEDPVKVLLGPVDNSALVIATCLTRVDQVIVDHNPTLKIGS